MTPELSKLIDEAAEKYAGDPSVDWEQMWLCDAFKAGARFVAERMGEENQRLREALAGIAHYDARLNAGAASNMRQFAREALGDGE